MDPVFVQRNYLPWKWNQNWNKKISKIDLCYKILEVTIEKLADTHIPKHFDLDITFLRDSPTGINPMSVS